MSKNDARTERRQRILNAALSCFLENGYNQSGIRDIAKKAGISLGNLYNHFAGKKAVLAEIASFEAIELRAFHDLLKKEGNPKDKLTDFIHKYTDYCGQTDTVILTVEILAESIRSPDIASLFLENRDDLIKTLSELLEAGHTTGDFQPVENRLVASELILEAIENHTVRNFLKKKSSAEDLDSLITFIQRSIFQGHQGLAGG